MVARVGTKAQKKFRRTLNFAIRSADSVSKASMASRLSQTVAAALILLLYMLVVPCVSACFFSFALAGSFVLYVFSQPERREVCFALAAAAGYAVFYFLAGGRVFDFPGVSLAVPGAFLGLGAILAVAGRMIWQTRGGALLGELLFLPAFCNLSIAAVAFASAHTPLTYDYSAYALDANLGFPPFLVGRWFVSCPVLFACCALAYNSLPLYLSLARAVQLRFALPGTPDLRLAYAVLGTAGFVLYQVCPVAGPLYRFGAMFPFHPPFAVPPGPAPLFPAARNGMPSLHFGWVLLVFRCCRCYRGCYRRTWIAVLAGLFLILTTLATLGSGEHYVVDLLVAIPLVWAVYAACSPNRSTIRWSAIVAAVSLTLFCLVGVRNSGSGQTRQIVGYRR